MRRKGTAYYSAVVILLVMAVQLVTACSTPTRAKVVSREQPARKAEARATHHRVRKHDTLYSIAWRYGLDFHSLARWNGIAPPYTIFPDQSLRLTKPPARVHRQQQTPKSRAPASSRSEKPQNKAAANSSQPVKKKPSKKPAAKAAQPAYRKRLVWHWPARGTVIQQYENDDRGSKGIKIRGSSGQTVQAAEQGKVVYAGSGLIGYGRLIIIKHNKNYLSAYGHNRKLLVKEGAVVDKGQPIAEMGRKGDGRPVLHFEIRRNGVPVDPLKLLPKRS